MTRITEAVSIEAVTKSFGPVRALDGVSLDVAAGEFVALLGPSGSGKTTLLTAIAGFEKPDSGVIKMGDRDVTSVPPHRRGLGIVFQRYALFPHLSVERNIAYPLEVRGIARSDRPALIRSALELVGLEQLGGRRVDQLSGGQQQRVALARALVFDPPVLLMDEPLGALDRKLREQVQLEIRRIHKTLGATILFVTHDQEEAMVMADRIAVMDNASIQQVGSPAELYHRPVNRFVAGFLGAMNFLPGIVGQRTGAKVTIELSGRHFQAHASSPEDFIPGRNAVLAVRPENVTIDLNGQGLPGIVKDVVFAGATTTFECEAAGQTVTATVPSEPGTLSRRPGDQVFLSWPESAALAYPSASGDKSLQTTTAN
jgi:ABC-type Fe3+/spermidine/putrescine transport system ATPase subunit